MTTSTTPDAAFDTDSGMDPSSKFDDADLVRRIREADLIPTWHDAKLIVGRTPAIGYSPHRWRWDDCWSLLAEAGDVITPERGAERRSLDHVNPTLPAGSLSTTHAMGTAFQLVRPGEVAPAHRHAAAAIRFVVRGGSPDSYTMVDGERLPMEDRDLLLTPSSAWHDHHNHSDHDIVWFDALDYPLVNLLRASWAEVHPDLAQPETLPVDHSRRHVGTIADATGRGAQRTPVYRYRWSDVEAWLSIARRGDPHPHWGLVAEYRNDTVHRSTLPTFGCYVQELAVGFSTEPVRESCSRAMLALDSHGTIRIGEHDVEWEPGDVISVPPWNWVSITNDGDEPARFFNVSERPVLELLGLYRTEESS